MVGGNDAKNDFIAFLESYALFIGLGFVAIIAITLLIILVILPRKHKKRDNNPLKINENTLLLLLGGKENLIDVKAVGSRLSLVCKDYLLVNIEELKKYGVISAITMSDKLIMVCENSTKLLNLIEKSLQN